MDENPYKSPEEPRSHAPWHGQISPFIRVFAGIAVLAFCLSVVFDVSMLYILGGFALLYLLGLMLVGVFKSPEFDGSAPAPAPTLGLLGLLVARAIGRFFVAIFG
jgi:hypothetical protein